MFAAVLLACVLAGQVPESGPGADSAVEEGAEPEPQAAATPPPALERAHADDEDAAPQPRAGTRGKKPQRASSAEAMATLRDVARPVAQREAAIRVLVQSERPGADELFELLLQEDDAVSIRLLCARALERRRVGGPALASSLQNDVEPRVRRAAARALGRMGGDGTRQETALVAALEDPEPTVATEAAVALGNVGSRASLEALQAVSDSEDRALRAAARRAHTAVGRRAEAVRQSREKEVARQKQGPGQSFPFMARVLRHGGTVYAVGFGAALGAAVGGVVPLMVWGPKATPAWPIGSVVGAAGGAALGLGYGALRAFDFPLWDALLISEHAASGFMAGVGYGLWLGDRSSPAFTAGLGILGGGASLLVSAGVSPFLRARPSVPLGAASGALLGGMASLMMGGAFGYDLFARPETALGLAFIGQGAGTLLGTALTASVPVTSVDLLMVDAGAVAGAAVTSGVALVALSLPFTRINSGVVNGAVLGGMALGGGGGALLAGFLPSAFERRLAGAFELEEWPIKLIPNLPVPVVQPQTQKVSGALVPLLGGSFR